MAIREIVLSDNISITYTYSTSLFTIYNTTYSTTRTTVASALALLKVIAPNKDAQGNPLDKDNNPITTARLQALAEDLETLATLSYTLADTGEYVATIQLNSFKENPLAIDMQKQKLYIMNTNIIHDLTLNDSVSHRVSVIKDYYKRHLGLDISTSDLTALYDLLTSYDTPHPYNVVNSKATKYYSSTIDFSNPNSTASITYSLLANPNSLYTYPTAYYIKQINSNRVLELTTAPTTLAVGQTIVIANTTTVIEGATSLEDTSYSSDGTYTISAIQDNYVKVAESLAQFSTTYKTCYLRQPSLTISSADRSANTITCTTTIPNSILIGDTIYVTGTEQTIDFQEVSINGSYTVYSVTDSTVTVQETLPTNFTASTPNNSILAKRIELGNITSIKNKVITVTGTVPAGIEGLTVVIDDTDYTVTSCTTNTITVTEDVEDYTPSYGELQLQAPYTNVKASILTTDNTEMPVGEFLLDTYQETIDYLATALPTSHIPTLTNFNMVEQGIPTTMAVEGCSVATMQLLGLYSTIYTS